MPLKTLLLLSLALLLPQLTRAELLVKDGQSVAFLGDSITAQGTDVPGGYVKLVVAGLSTLGVHITMIPAGAGGNTSKDMLARLDKDVISKKPDWMTLSCGVNDVWHGAAGVDLEDYKTNITSILDQCQAAHIQVLVMTATCIQENDTFEENKKLAAYNDWLRATAKARNLPLADESAAYWAALKAAPPHQGNFLTNDGVHPNPAGHQIMASTILAAFGATPAQVARAQQDWVNMPNSANLEVHTDFMIGPITIAGYRKIVALAQAHHTSVSDYSNILFVGPLGEAMVEHANDDPPATKVQIEADARQRFVKKLDALPNP
jgi:lysophospholipase L1-like esterase